MRAGGIIGFGLDLKRVYRKNMVLGFGLSSAIIVMTGAVIVLLSAPESAGDSVTDSRPHPPPLPPPITIDPGPGPSGGPNRPEPRRPTIGIPVPVPESEASEAASHPRQIDFNFRAPGDPGGDGLTVAVGMGAGVGPDDMLPSPDTFVPFEEAPIPVKAINPVYPDLARRAGIEGHVWLKVLIDREGAVRDVLVVAESDKDAGFGEAASIAARKCVWRPAIANGQPVAVWITYKIVFKLEN